MAQHFSASIYIGDYLVTGELSDYRFELTELSDDKMVLHRNTANQSTQLHEREENELQAIDAGFDEDLTTDERIEVMNKKQEIQNRYASEDEQILSNAQTVEAEIDKKITMKETQIQVLEATKQTYDDYLDQTDMSYFDT